jgi:hypothetical protein
MFDYLNSTMMVPGEYSGCQPLTHTDVARTLFRAGGTDGPVVLAVFGAQLDKLDGRWTGQSMMFVVSRFAVGMSINAIPY